MLPKTADDLGDLFESPLKAEPKTPPTNYVNPENANIAPSVKKLYEERCPRCGGTGRWGWKGLVCRACGGSGKRAYRTAPTIRAKNKVSRQKHKAELTNQKIKDIEQFKNKDHPEVFAWLTANARMVETGENFAMSLLHGKYGLLARGYLTEGQLAAVYRILEKEKASAAERKAREEAAAVTIDMTALDKAFAFAGPRLKTPLLRIGSFKIGVSKAYKGLYVVDGDTKIGKIVDGKFIPYFKCSDEQTERLIAIAADPNKELEKHGHLTGHCGICGHLLTNPKSKQRGIGPICARKFGW